MAHQSYSQATPLFSIVVSHLSLLRASASLHILRRSSGLWIWRMGEDSRLKNQLAICYHRKVIAMCSCSCMSFLLLRDFVSLWWQPHSRFVWQLFIFLSYILTWHDIIYITDYPVFSSCNYFCFICHCCCFLTIGMHKRS